MENRLAQIEKKEKKETQVIKKVRQLELDNVPSELAQEKKNMRIPRSKKYIKLMNQIDHLSDKDKVIMDMVQSIPVNNKLLGILSECGIEGCIIHAIDKWGNILDHYRNVDEMSEDLQKGYNIYMEHKGCVSVEVYTYTFCVIYNDGTVKFIEREK